MSPFICLVHVHGALRRHLFHLRADFALTCDLLAEISYSWTREGGSNTLL